MRSQGGGEPFAEQHEAVFAPFAQVHTDLAWFVIYIGDSEVVEFTDSHGGVEEQPDHQGVLNVLGTIHDLKEPPELVGGQDTGQLTPLLGRSKVTNLPDPLGDVSPPLTSGGYGALTACLLRSSNAVPEFFSR
jgi:hypothetical protein